MAKFLYYSDLHLRPERIQDCEIVLDEIPKIAKSVKADFVVNGGDTFNTRGMIKTSCFDLLYRKYSEWFNQGIKQIIIPGNHDQEDRDGKIHPMRVFSTFDGWHVIDRPQMVPNTNMIFVPYMKDEEAIKYLHSVLSSSAIQAGKWDATVHLGIRGAKMNNSRTDEEGIPVDLFKKFRRVFSGHYHFRNEFANIQYIGSPFQQNFGERDQRKGVFLYDNKTGKKEFIEILGTQLHHVVEIEWRDEKKILKGDVKSIGERDFVSVKVVGDAEQCSSLDEKSLGLKTGNIAFDRQVRAKALSRLNISASEIFNHKQLMKKYVDFVEVDLDKKKLLQVGEEIVG